MKEEGEDLIADLDKQVDESFAKYPALKGKSLIFSYFDPADLSQIGFYTTNDTRPGFMESVGEDRVYATLPTAMAAYVSWFHTETGRALTLPTSPTPPARRVRPTASSTSRSI